jgi:hypothetical protein
MKDEAQKTIKKIAELRDELETQERHLAMIRQECAHQWEPVEYIPQHRTKGIPNVTSITKETVRRWERRCAVCALVQHTEKAKMVGADGVIPGTRVAVEELDWTGTSK